MLPIEIFALSYFGRFSLEEIENLTKSYGSISELLESEFMGFNERFKARYDEKFVEEQERKVEQLGVKLVTFWDEDYPKLLRSSIAPPAVLFCLGDIKLLNENCVAVVGTRRLTSYGKVVTKRIVTDLVKANLVVVSGMALGVDSEVHRAVLENDGKTVAVLGTGVDVCYPSSNRLIYERILRNGCVVSEYPLGTKAAKQNFPARNRIIAGICRATIVTEAPVDSGALITARMAAEIGRDVFAVPGDIDRVMSEGCNWLLKMGAIPLTDSSQILEYYGVNLRKDQTRDEFLQLFTDGPLLAEEIAERLKMDLSQVLSKLTEYELSGSVVKLPSGHYNKL